MSQVLQRIGDTDLPRSLVVAAARQELERIRGQTQSSTSPPPSIDTVVEQIKAALDRCRRRRLQPVINGTGILIHTNLGRAPLGRSVADAVAAAAMNYTNLEYDLIDGSRGGRAPYLEHILAMLCGADAATIVNNCAAALVLILRYFASASPKTQVIISRGELIQIGGGFRIPEILQASGATLREVGTTNVTTLADYEAAISEQSAMILRVHQSNFSVSGFASQPATAELANLARAAKILLVEDLGSGATFDTLSLGGGEHEPTPAATLAAGADLVCFSGDKLLGGPQAGIIAGKAIHVAALRKDPFFRALRCDKLVLSAMEATVELLLSGRTEEMPIRSMMQIPLDALQSRADHIIQQLREQGIAATQGAGESQTGGGSLPHTVLPSVTIDTCPSEAISIHQLAADLRRCTPPLVGFVEEGRFKIDLRTVFPSQDQAVVRALLSVLQRS
jgi:L-seryl-tRNA(Ser) seleniumtransferase